ncbi:phosphate starvation-inducible protein PsiE, partial [Algoriphagus lacus]
MYKIFVFLFSLTLFIPADFFPENKTTSILCFSYLLKDKELNIDDVLTDIDTFSYNNCEEFNFGINDQAVWIKIDNQDLTSYSNPLLVLNSSSLDYVYLYSVSGGKIENELVSG